jgi:hypothetical protein
MFIAITNSYNHIRGVYLIYAIRSCNKTPHPVGAASACMRARSVKHTSDRNWNLCAVTSRAHRLRQKGCQSMILDQVRDKAGHSASSEYSPSPRSGCGPNSGTKRSSKCRAGTRPAGRGGCGLKTDLRIGMLAQVCARAAACAGRIQDILEIDPAQNPDFSASALRTPTFRHRKSRSSSGFLAHRLWRHQLDDDAAAPG